MFYTQIDGIFTKRNPSLGKDFFSDFHAFQEP